MNTHYSVSSSFADISFEFEFLWLNKNSEKLLNILKSIKDNKTPKNKTTTSTKTPEECVDYMQKLKVKTLQERTKELDTISIQNKFQIIKKNGDKRLCVSVLL